jgi:hypothetical protein
MIGPLTKVAMVGAVAYGSGFGSAVVTGASASQALRAGTSAIAMSIGIQVIFAAVSSWASAPAAPESNPQYASAGGTPGLDSVSDAQYAVPTAGQEALQAPLFDPIDALATFATAGVKMLLAGARSAVAYAYHVTYTENVSSIMSQGLRCGAVCGAASESGSLSEKIWFSSRDWGNFPGYSTIRVREDILLQMGAQRGPGIGGSTNLMLSGRGGVPPHVPASSIDGVVHH